MASKWMVNAWGDARDLLARDAMRAMLANPDWKLALDDLLDDGAVIARYAYAVADAMLAERDRRPEGGA